MKDNISSTQWISILAASMTAVLMMNYIKLFVAEVGRGTYVSAILICVATFFLLCFVIFLSRQNQFQTPLHTFTVLAGRNFALCLCSLAALGFLLFSVETLNIFIYIVKFYFLPQTPTWILAAVLFLPAAFTAYCGFRTFGSMASASVFAFLLFLLMFPFTKNNYFTANVLPWNDFQWQDIIGSLPILFLSAPAVAASFFILPFCSQREKLYRKATLFAIALCVLMVFIYLAGMTYFGENIIGKLILPFYNLSPFFKGNLLERFDIIYMMALIPTISIFNSFAFSVFALIQQDIFIAANTKHRRTLIFFCSLFVVIIASFTVDRLPLWDIYRGFNAGALGFALLFSLLFIAAIIKKRRVTV